MTRLASRRASQMCERGDAGKETLAGDGMDAGGEAFVALASG